jgi:hypothetical protein
VTKCSSLNWTALKRIRHGVKIGYFHGMINSAEPPKQTLARMMGDVPHVSALWRKVRELSGCPDDRALMWLLKCAVERGAGHYNREFPCNLPPDKPQLSDEELAVALCLGQHPYNSVFIRAAAQLLTCPRTDVSRLEHLARMERIEGVLSYVANVAEKIAPDAQPWNQMRRNLKLRRPNKIENLPHWSRFVSQTGVTVGGGGPEICWLSRRETPK